MRDRRLMFSATVVAAAMAIFMNGASRAEDYCDTAEIMARSVNRDIAEKKIREKCKPGDIVFIDAGFLIPRLCDLREPVVRCGSTCPGGDQASFCFLSPPRKTY